MPNRLSTFSIVLTVLACLPTTEQAVAQSKLNTTEWQEFKLVARQYDSLQMVFREMIDRNPSLARSPMLMQQMLKDDMQAISEIFRAVPKKAQAAMPGLQQLDSYGAGDLFYIKLAAIAVNDLNTCQAASESLLSLLKAPDSLRIVRRELAQLLALRGSIDKAASYATDENMSDATDMERGQIYSAIAGGFAEEDRPGDAHPFVIKMMLAFRNYRVFDPEAPGMPGDAMQLQELEQQHRHFLISQTAKPLGLILHGYRAAGDTSAAARLLRESEAAFNDDNLWPETRGAAESYASQLAEEQRSSQKPAAEWTEHEWIGSGPVSLKELLGKVVLVDFFATWCKPCIMAFPYIRDWAEKYSSQGLVVLGMTNYQGRYDGKSVAPATEYSKLKDDFVPKHKLTWPVGIEKSGNQTFQDYGVGGIPHITLIDRSGMIRYTKAGAGDYEKTERMIRKLLAEKPPVRSDTPDPNTGK